MYPLAQVPAFGGKSASFFDYEQRVRLWGQAAGVNPSERASMLILRMDTIARQVCLNAGGDTFTQREAADAILKILRNYLQPDALGHLP